MRSRPGRKMTARPSPRTPLVLARPALLALALGGAHALGAPGAAAAQPAAPARRAATPTAAGWNDSTTLALVARATARRQAQLADTALRDWHATARGTLTFSGRLGDFVEVPRVVQGAQVATEVWWRAPNESKQIVVGERDTTLLPTDNRFYRDRFGIVQNNFPDLIRVGEGYDVRDVPHPLAPGGGALYDFAIRDSLVIRTAQRQYRVHEVQVRPRDPDAPRFVGTLFLDRDDAQVVRLAFTFTRSAYIDRRNESVAIVLENALVDGRFWLPRRQEVEVVRAGTFLDFPARGIIRGRWEIGGYAVNTSPPPATFAGPSLEFRPEAERRAYPFEGRVVDALPADVATVSDEDVRRVQAQALALVQARALQRARGRALSARAVSDFVRVNRVEGLALGGGVVLGLGGGASLRTQARYGLADGAVKGRVALEWRRPTGATFGVEGYREYREAGDVAEVSLVRNTLAAQEFGSDWTDPFDAWGGGVFADVGAGGARRLRLRAGLEAQDALTVNARPFTGRYARTIPATALTGARAELALEQPMVAGPLGVQWRGELRGRVTNWRAGRFDGIGCGADVGTACGTTLRASALVQGDRPLGGAGDTRLVFQTTVAAVGAPLDDAEPATRGGPARADANVPAQELVYLGGPISAPGYGFHALAGRVGASQRLELRTPVPFPSVSLGRYGASPARATLAPYAHVAYVARPAAFQPVRGGWYPSVGLGGQFFFDLLRVDVARGLRDGRWMFGVDVSRDFWRIL